MRDINNKYDYTSDNFECQIFKNLSDTIYKQYVEKLKDLMTNNVLLKPITDVNLTDIPIDEYITNWIKINGERLKNYDWSSETDGLSDFIYKIHRDEIKEKGSMIRLYNKIFIQQKEIINKSKVGFNIQYLDKRIVSDPKISTLLVTYNDDNINKILKNINENLITKFKNIACDTKIIKLENIINNYDNYTPYDHGIYASMLFSAIVNLYTNQIESAIELKGIKKKAMLLPWNFICQDKDCIKTNYVKNYESIFSEVNYALFIHNLYPSRFMDSNLKMIKTSMKDNGFSYLALLADSLQYWNRPKILMQAREPEERPYLSNLYDMIVEEKMITLNVIRSYHYTQSYYENQIIGLDSFLEDASKLININTIQNDCDY